MSLPVVPFPRREPEWLSSMGRIYADIVTTMDIQSADLETLRVHAVNLHLLVGLLETQVRRQAAAGASQDLTRNIYTELDAVRTHLDWFARFGRFATVAEARERFIAALDATERVLQDSATLEVPMDRR